MLSFTTLSDDPQSLGFLVELTRKLDQYGIEKLRSTLGRLFRSSLRPRRRGYSGYEPRRLTVPSRHAAYSANLLILNVLVSNHSLRASSLLANCDHVMENWQSFALLWRSQLGPASWDGLVNALVVTYAPENESDDLVIRHERHDSEESLDTFSTVNWLTESCRESSGEMEHKTRAEVSLARTARNASFLRLPEIDLLIHALHPALRLRPDDYKTLEVGLDGEARSVTHCILDDLMKRNSSVHDG